MRITAWQVKSSESSRVHTVGFTSPAAPEHRFAPWLLAQEINQAHQAQEAAHA